MAAHELISDKGEMSSRTVQKMAITGVPGVGKTTLVKKLCDFLHKQGVPAVGFYTEELRDKGRRIGFDVVTLDGQRGPLARIEPDEPHAAVSKYRVGQYAVQLSEFETLALKVLTLPTTLTAKCVIIVDEIGKMEMFSMKFVQVIKKLLSDKNAIMIVTLPVAKGKPIPLVEEVRHTPSVQLVTVTKENRNFLHEEIEKKLMEILKN